MRQRTQKHAYSKNTCNRAKPQASLTKIYVRSEQANAKGRRHRVGTCLEDAQQLGTCSSHGLKCNETTRVSALSHLLLFTSLAMSPTLHTSILSGQPAAQPMVPRDARDTRSLHPQREGAQGQAHLDQLEDARDTGRNPPPSAALLPPLCLRKLCSISSPVPPPEVERGKCP